MLDLLVAGDFSPKDRVDLLIEKDNTKGVLSDVKDIITSADYSVVNFETAVITSNSKMIKKAGPGMHCGFKAAYVLADAGFNAVTLANNHIMDFGEEGFSNSLKSIEEAGLQYFGAGKNIKEASQVFIKEIRGKKLAFINVCEHEFSIADENRCGAAPLDIVNISRRISLMKSIADYIIVIIHGGNEHYQLPSPRMKDTYRFFIEQGADAVINHHQHCYSGYEVYNGKPIFYGLGNFCFDWEGKRNSIWNEGFLLRLELKDTIGFDLIPYIQCDEEPRVMLMNEVKKAEFFKHIDYLNSIISDDNLLNKEYDEFCQRRKRSIICPFTPYLNSYVRIAAGRHYIPYLIPEQKLCGQINFIECESHRDVLLKVLHDKLEK